MFTIASIPNLRNIILSALLSVIAFSAAGQSLKDIQVTKDDWIFQMTADKQSHQMAIHYTSATGETLRMSKDYSNPEGTVKFYIFNEGQASVEIKGSASGLSINTNLPINNLRGSQSVDYGIYQLLVEEYRLVLAELQASMGAQPFATIDNLSRFFECDQPETRATVLECATTFFAYTAAAISEEAICVSGLTPPCQAAISTAISAFTAMISVCSNVEDDDGNGNGDGDPGNGGGNDSDGGGDAGSGGVAIVYYGGRSGGGGGPDCSWGCGGEDNCTLTLHRVKHSELYTSPVCKAGLLL